MKKYEKIKNIDERKAFETIYAHCTTNKHIIHDFVHFICGQYFFPKGSLIQNMTTSNKKGLSFKEFLNIAMEN